jgi:hypothetical protein
VFEFRPYGFVVKTNTKYIESLDDITPTIPPKMQGVLQSGGCGCRNKCSPDFYMIKHGGNEYWDCKNYGWYFTLTTFNEYEIIKKWIETEVENSLS